MSFTKFQTRLMRNKVCLVTTIAFFGLCASINAHAINLETCLKSAYPEIKSVKNGTILFQNGVSMPVGQVSNKPFVQRLNHASVADQLSQTYPLSFTIPKQYEDPGRLRNDDFFKALYGKSANEVRSNLVAVKWKPSGKTIQFNKRNNAAAQLQKVGDEIALQPGLSKYVSKSLGSFNWRVVAGTNRLSNHSFGISVDFDLPKPLYKYWRWDGCKSEDKPCKYPVALMQDDKLKQIVRIFEKHGFIWGGKWASYDSMHFEYRPELLNNQCR